MFRLKAPGARVEPRVHMAAEPKNLPCGGHWLCPAIALVAAWSQRDKHELCPGITKSARPSPTVVTFFDTKAGASIETVESQNWRSYTKTLVADPSRRASPPQHSLCFCNTLCVRCEKVAPTDGVLDFLHCANCPLHMCTIRCLDGVQKQWPQEPLADLPPFRCSSLIFDKMTYLVHCLLRLWSRRLLLTQVAANLDALRVIRSRGNGNQAG